MRMIGYFYRHFAMEGVPDPFVLEYIIICTLILLHFSLVLQGCISCDSLRFFPHDRLSMVCLVRMVSIVNSYLNMPPIPDFPTYSKTLFEL